MLNLIIVIAVVLILAILVTVFRVITLVNVAKGEGSKSVPPTNRINALLLMLFLIVGLFGFFYYSFGGLQDDFVLPLASEHGAVTDRLFWITMGITCFVFIVTQIFLFGFAYKYQHKEGNKADFYPHNNKLEVIWTAIPAIVLALLIVSGWKAWSDITGKAPDNAEVIEVMGYQFSWSVRYPGADKSLGDSDFQKMDVTNSMGIDFTDQASFDDFIPTQLVLPKGRPVLLKIRAKDVIHSVFQPHFRMQMNAVPGMPTRFWFVPTKTTEEMREETGNPDFNYELVCNKICGYGHFGMKYSILVLEADEYDQWYADQQAWLKLNDDYLSEVPDNLKEAARIAAGIDNVISVDKADKALVSN
ncbi:MAG: cytochrome c oxidase subunit II [Cyclobacteriaceae bacterium]